MHTIPQSYKNLLITTSQQMQKPQYMWRQCRSTWSGTPSLLWKLSCLPNQSYDYTFLCYGQFCYNRQGRQYWCLCERILTDFLICPEFLTITNQLFGDLHLPANLCKVTISQPLHKQFFKYVDWKHRELHSLAAHGLFAWTPIQVL